MSGLAVAWLRTAHALGARGDLADAGVTLLARWSEPHRRYHNVSHLSEVLERIDLLVAAGAPVLDLEHVRAAAWFHDAVYDPTADDNEQRSAALAVELLASHGVDPARVADVERLVLLTRSHDPSPDDADGALLCDADLGVLAGSAEEYARYATAVRAEYAHLDDQTWRLGRTAVLRGLLARASLFSTAAGRSRWEPPARAHLQAELAALAAADAG